MWLVAYPVYDLKEIEESYGLAIKPLYDGVGRASDRLQT